MKKEQRLDKLFHRFATHTFVGVLVFHNHIFIIFGWKPLQSRIAKTPPFSTA